MNKKKHLFPKLAISLLLGFSTLICLANCTSNSGAANYNWDDIQEEEENNETHIVTFHYGFNDVDFNTQTKEIPNDKYTGIYKAISKNGRKIALNPMIKKMFCTELSYKIRGYSNESWQKNGISSDFDVYVLYDVRKQFDVTFKYETFTKTIKAWEDLEIEEKDIPTPEEMGFKENTYLCGWTNNEKFESVKESFTTEALVANMGEKSMKIEAEEAQYIDLHKSANGGSTFSDIGSGGKSVYIINSGCSSTCTITMSINTVKPIELGLLAAVYIREKPISVKLFDLYKITVTLNGTDYLLEDGTFNDTFKIINGKNKNNSMVWGEFEEMPIGIIKFPQGVSKITIAAYGAPITGSNIDYIRFVAKEDLKYSLALEGNVIPLNPIDVVKGPNKVLLQAEKAQNISVANMTSVVISDFSSALGEGYSLYLSNKSNEQKGYFDYTYYSNKASKAMMSIMLMTRADVDAPILNGYDIFVLDENKNYTTKLSPKLEGMVNEEVKLSQSFGEFHMFMVGYINVKKGLNTFRIMSDGLVLPSNVDYIELAFDDTTVEITTPKEGEIPNKGTFAAKFNAEDFNVLDAEVDIGTETKKNFFSDFGEGDKSLYIANAGQTRQNSVELFIESEKDTKAILSSTQTVRASKTYNALDLFDLYFANGTDEYTQVLKDGYNKDAIALNEIVVDNGKIYSERHSSMLAEVSLKKGINRIKLVTDGVRLGAGINFDYLEVFTKENISITKAEVK